jgi:short-subunit dehydrogenase
MEPENNVCTLVTGSSLGIGKAIAKELASRNHNLILNSLPGQGLPDLCHELESAFKIRTYYVESDLATEKGPENLFEFVQNNRLRVNILINNAGIGYEGPIEGYSQKQIDHMILLNVRAMTLLTVFFTPELKTHNRSYILNISSFGGYLPTAYKSVYLATKSYVYYLTKALESELKGSSLKTCVAVPSAVRTNKNTLDRIERNGWFGQKSALNPEEVAVEVLNGMFKGKKVILPGRLSRLFFSIALFVPEGIMMILTRRIFKNYRQG